MVKTVDIENHGLQFRADYPVGSGSDACITYGCHLMPCPTQGEELEQPDGINWLLVVEIAGEETKRTLFGDYNQARRSYMRLVSSFMNNASTVRYEANNG